MGLPFKKAYNIYIGEDNFNILFRDSGVQASEGVFYSPQLSAFNKLISFVSIGSLGKPHRLLTGNFAIKISNRIYC